MGWQSTDTAPRDGSEFLARVIERGPFSPACTYRYDIAKWVEGSAGGYFRSRSGNIVSSWMPLPEPPEQE